MVQKFIFSVVPLHSLSQTLELLIITAPIRPSHTSHLFPPAASTSHQSCSQNTTQIIQFPLNLHALKIIGVPLWLSCFNTPKCEKADFFHLNALFSVFIHFVLSLKVESCTKLCTVRNKSSKWKHGTEESKASPLPVDFTHSARLAEQKVIQYVQALNP